MAFTQEELLEFVGQANISAEERGRLYAFINTSFHIAEKATNRVPAADVVVTLQGYLSLPAGGVSQDDVVAAIQDLKAGQQLIQAAIAERFSQTRQASKIKLAELEQVTETIKCRVLWASGDPTLDELLGPPPEEEFWDQESPEPAQRQRCASELKRYFPKTRRGPSAFELHDAKGKTVKMTCEGIPYPLAGQNDELISLRRYHNDPQHGAIMGVELKKKLSWAAVRQSQTEFLLFAAKSWYPYCQMATDLEKGGIAYYMSGHVGGHRIITGRVFGDMASFWKFYSDFLENTPMALGADDEANFPEELPNPKRMKFHLQMPTGD
ncbi:hypothetical protein COCOBI_07-5520 [Coccomyxa sp. Obi]|nr:hypothetical protein COCOBI_07-5520 [Coccomyxa sp. Obi]